MAAPVPLYSSSPQSSAFSATRSLSGVPVISSPKDADAVWLSDSNFHWKMRAGGLSTLLSGGSQKAVSASISSVETQSLGHGIISPDQFRSDTGSFTSRYSQAMSIPVGSLICKDKSPVSVFSVDSSIRTAIVSPKVNSLHRHDLSHPSSVDAQGKPRRKSGQECITTGQPKHRSVGFAVRQDTHCFSEPCISDLALAAKPDAKVSRRSALRSGLASVQGLVDSISDLATLSGSLATTQRSQGDKVAWARDEVLRIVHEGKGLSLAPLRERAHQPACGSTEDASVTSVITSEDWYMRAQARFPVFNDALVRKAFNVAAVAHQNQYRKSGEPVIAHSVATAEILAGIGADSTAVAAGLLHDVLDDTLMSEQQLREIFGDDIADLVSKVSRVSTVCQLMRDNARTLDGSEVLLLRSMLLAMGSDVRIVLVKLADRLHNLRTLYALPPHKQQRIAKQTLELFAPLANRLGIWSWKAEMEDICFAYLHPEEHSLLEQQVKQQGKDEEGVMAAISSLDRALREQGVRFEDLSGRPKNLYSIFMKMQKKEKTLDQIFDVRGLRLICSDEASCHVALDVVHSLWQMKGGRHFKDYISNPKANGYQSIHTVVEDEAGNCLEVQIRTADMHQHAEFGVAAHWRYKEDDSKAENGGKNSWSLPAQQQAQVEWARFCLSWIAEKPDTKMRIAQPVTHSALPACGHASLSQCTTGGCDAAGSGSNGGNHSVAADAWACWRSGQCKFPEHAEGCAYAKFPFAQPPPWMEKESEDPVVVIVWEGENMSVEEVPPNTSIADFLSARKASRTPSPSLLPSSPHSPPSHGSFTRVLLNSELLEGNVVAGVSSFPGLDALWLGGLGGGGVEDEGDRHVFSVGGVSGDISAWAGISAGRSVSTGQPSAAATAASTGLSRSLQWGDLIQIVEEEGQGTGAGDHSLPAVVSYADWLDEGGKAVREQEEAVAHVTGSGSSTDLVGIEFHRQRLAASWKSGDAKQKEMVGV